MDIQTLDSVKRLELKILKYVDRICRANGLKYYLIGGTLLGAIRHKGFIPWDDDIDIVMFREDYNKFLDIVNQGDNTYFVQNTKSDPNYTRYITKIRLNDTLFVEESSKNLLMHQGIFIDIFPLDKIVLPINEKRIVRRIYIANKILRVQKIKIGVTEGRTIFLTKRNELVKFLLKGIPSNLFTKWVDFIYTLDNNKDTDLITNFSSQYGWRKQSFNIDVFGEGTYLEFEGHQFMAPAKWEIILKSLYGDYMKLPPEEKQNSGHIVVQIELGKYAEN